jgi:hypothetical protein
MKIAIISLLFLGSVSALAATKAQVSAAVNATNIDNVTSVTEDSTQPRCFGCRILTVKGEGAFGDAWQQIEVDQNGLDSYSTKVLSQSK